MTAIKTVVRNGRIEVSTPTDLPDGTVVSLSIAAAVEPEAISDDDWDNSPEGIADWLKWYDALEPLLMTPQEEADAEAWMRKVNAYGRANLDKGTEELFP